MPKDEKDQELEDSSSSHSAAIDTQEETASGVEGGGAEDRNRVARKKDEIIERLQKQRDRDRERVANLEDQLQKFQAQFQPQSTPQVQQQVPVFDWQNPEQSINGLVSRAVTQAVQQTRVGLKTEIQREAEVERAREFMQTQRGYNEEELQQVFEENPELRDVANVNPMSAVKTAVKIWRIQKGDTDMFSKKAAAAGVQPTATPARQKGVSDLFERVRDGGEKTSDEDIQKSLSELRKLEASGAQIM